MHIAALALQNFRLYPQLEMQLGKGLTIIVGPNASGKTSLLEAIHLLATTKSPRTHVDRRLIRWDEHYCRAEGTFVSSAGDTTSIRVGIGANGVGADGAPKQMWLNGSPTTRVSDIIGHVGVVMFASEDLDLVKGPPQVRRRFLNMALCQLRPRYLDDSQRYRRALLQRNAVLKQIRGGEATRASLEPWTRQLVQAGAAITVDRAEFLDTLTKAADITHNALSGCREQLALEYRSDLAGSTSEAAEAVFERALDAAADRDCEGGFTSVGPHRDDFEIRISGIPARTYGSQGQQRTAALSLKLAQADVVMAWRGESPLLLLDDCLSELDDCRCAQVLEMTGVVDGLIITSPLLTEQLAARSDARFFHIDDGSVRAVAPQELSALGSLS